MDNRMEVREFLSSRRARITPEKAGLTVYGAIRRVPGLRREEAAMLAGVSVDYYTRLERGNLAGVSEGVLDALARGLQLDDAERDHLFDLARATNASARTRQVKAPKQRIRPSVQAMLDAIIGAPAFIRNGRMDLLAANRLGYALYAPMLTDPVRPVNYARFIFLNPRARDFYPDWNLAANNNVALLRTESGRNPYDKGLADLVGELSLRSEEFRVRWAAHNVRRHYSGNKHFHHPVVGDLELQFEALQLAEDPGLTLTVYPAQPGSASAESLRLLASWAATEQAEELTADNPA
ncbi:helix-turn-helix transcriptional regulator [Arthrobacter sp. PM3]|uniref:helix-turn-helix transcriptional regulator n=1 Tax=Arthrobacter sp. PM3 TaxID=2017685 RepID=UPI000E10A987|nr:helix-turn-helix transcriptional regulator [Arthrobacter sp. PM3]AXJ10911.1 transcriptional regulator [Arthrobacter sp. PM3]